LGKHTVWQFVFTTVDEQTGTQGLSAAIIDDSQRKVMVPARTIVLLVGR